ncbi:MAG: MalY/PatB family protein [Candidatus Izemoplasmataceae bacterium]
MEFKTLNRKNTNALKWDQAIKESESDDTLAFSVADSDYETAPVIKEALMNRIDHGAFGYSGLGEDYYDIIINYVKNQYGASINKSWIVPGNKILTSIIYLMETLSYLDDEVVIQTPVYHMFKHIIETNERTVIENPLINTNGFYTMDFEHLEKVFKQGAKIFLFCNPHNPVGRVWNEKELDQVVTLCKKYDVILISDEIHADIIIGKQPFRSLMHYFDRYENIYVTIAPSKTFNIAGLKISNTISNNLKGLLALRKTFDKHLIHTPNLLAVTALKAAYTKGIPWLEAQNKHILDNYTYAKTFILKHFPKILISPLEGTYLMWLDLNCFNHAGNALHNLFLSHGLVLANGIKFGQNANGFMRLNLACSKEQLINGLNRFKEALDTIT